MSTQNPTLTLSLQGGQLIATDENNHSVRVECDVNGVRVLKHMLLAKNNLPKRFATATQPTQQMVEDFMKDRNIKKQMKSANEMQDLKEMF